MSANGNVKTPKATRAKELNQSKSSSGKKFVQTRLPFKLLTPLAKAAAEEQTATASTATADEQREPRKRKLSYDDDKRATSGAAAMEQDELGEGGTEKQLRSRNSKENLDVNNEDVIELDDDEEVEEEELVEEEKEHEQLEEEQEQQEPTEAEPMPEKKNSRKLAPIQIHLPLNNNKRAKRRKALIKSSVEASMKPADKERSDSSDDVESLQPQKRPKVIEPKENGKSNAKAKSDANANPKMDMDTILLDNSDVAMDVEMQQVEEKPPILTAKQQKILEQRRKAREEKEHKLQEERRLKQLEKEQREQQKKAEREQKEEERRKEREQKEEERRKEREEKERKRQAETEEKRKRNEAKEEVQRKRDEERRRKEQEKEEAELKKKRAAASFTKFFVPKRTKQTTSNSHNNGNGNGNSGCLEHEQNSSDSSGCGSQMLAFRPFQVKDDMIVAPVIRGTLPSDTRQLLDSLFHDDDQLDEGDANESITRGQLYLSELSLGRHKPLRGKRDARLDRCAKDEEEDDDVQVIDDLATAGTPIVVERPKQRPWTRAKYLQFADNRRPPYYGTWRKRSQLISARRPLGQDKVHFDYEVDSDCEWEEEEPGESLSASEDEKERESEEESEEEYNEWFVPHGHLSEEELQNDGELDDGNTREAQKAKLQVLQQEFAQEMKKQTKNIKPRVLGPVWLDDNGNKSQLCPAVFIQTINMYACWQLKPLTLEPPPEPAHEEEAPEEAKAKPSIMQLDEPLLQQLVRLVHGNSKSKAFLISEYLEYLKAQIALKSQTLLLPPSKTLLREKFDELAGWKSVEMEIGVDAKKSKKPKKRLCWVVNAAALHKYQLDDLTLQNRWTYTLTPKTTKTGDTSLHEITPPSHPETPVVVVASTSDISKFTTGTSTPTAAPLAAVPSTKKRATLLMSALRDQNALISQYLRKQSDKANAKNSPPAAVAGTGHSSDVVVLLSD
ncbi:chromatin assembly factor 1 subunit A-B [Drosophila grimshawi]|uniref:GH24209 n=1 Tax=Drosophila grimshawi TaxID=7222 RepID=B4JN42_DROGR|nr:chromatin assembly factor 1 subunit A-B [Drosophila grimshawi]EDV92135.1 GH24209 [Drosophila grimshawi]